MVVRRHTCRGEWWPTTSNYTLRVMIFLTSVSVNFSPNISQESIGFQKKKKKCHSGEHGNTKGALRCYIALLGNSGLSFTLILSLKWYSSRLSHIIFSELKHSELAELWPAQCHAYSTYLSCGWCWSLICRTRQTLKVDGVQTLHNITLTCNTYLVDSAACMRVAHCHRESTTSVGSMS